MYESKKTKAARKTQGAAMNKNDEEKEIRRS
jgi:hypothetical protein